MNEAGDLSERRGSVDELVNRFARGDVDRRGAHLEAGVAQATYLLPDILHDADEFVADGTVVVRGVPAEVPEIGAADTSERDATMASVGD